MGMKPQPVRWTSEMLTNLCVDRQTMSLRQLGKKYGVSHERIRQVIWESISRGVQHGGDLALLCKHWKVKPR